MRFSLLSLIFSAVVIVFISFSFVNLNATDVSIDTVTNTSFIPKTQPLPSPVGGSTSFPFLDYSSSAKDSPVVTDSTDNFDNLFTEVFKPITNSIKSTPLPSTPTEKPISPPAGESSPPTTSQITPTSISEDVVFNKLWPDYYRNHLLEVQDLLINQLIISSANKKDFTHEDEIYDFLNTYANYFREVAELSDIEYNDLQRKLNQVPILKDRQRREIITSLGLVSWLKNITKTAEAVYISTGFCYKDDAPFNPAPGIVSPNFCCNCGMVVTPVTTFFLADCGPYGAACQIPLGCLNSTCRAFPNALWDITTTMCGCG